MCCRLDFVQELLTCNYNIDEIYDAMTKNDLSEVVMKALDIIKTTKKLPLGKNPDKSEEVSSLHRNEGNEAYKTGQFQRALTFYNKALVNAPKDSRELKLAYSNRSALFFTLKLWKASLFDINKCFELGCPPDILEKLTNRKQGVEYALVIDKFSHNVMVDTAQKCTFYRIRSKNSHISCASKDVHVTSPIPKVVASKDIKIGTIVACETAYVSCTQPNNELLSCHFCQKKVLNLIPCDDCCYALFCGEECKTKCSTEFHAYECQIMGAIRTLCFSPFSNLMVKAVLKLRKQCKSWKELIAASFNTGIRKIDKSSPEEVYDGKDIYSILSFRDDSPLVHGKIFHASFICAAILYHLDELPSFFPDAKNQKPPAMQAFARIMMYLSIYQMPLQIFQAQTDVRKDKSNYGPVNYGLFPFTGKLKYSCNPNLFLSNINNKLVLMAIRTIKSGEEVTIPYVTNPYDSHFERRTKNIKGFLYHSSVCDCPKCMGVFTGNSDILSESQKKYYSQLNMVGIDSSLRAFQITHAYVPLLQALEILDAVPNSKEYLEIYKRLRKCIFFFELIFSDNSIIGD